METLPGAITLVLIDGADANALLESSDHQDYLAAVAGYDGTGEHSGMASTVTRCEVANLAGGMYQLAADFGQQSERSVSRGNGRLTRRCDSANRVPSACPA